jgi:hypothetical protein
MSENESPTNDDTTPSREEGAPEDRARRRLLSLALYVPPALLGIISLQQAGCAAAGSCHPHMCNPSTGCNPISGDCHPHGG